MNKDKKNLPFGFDLNKLQDSFIEEHFKKPTSNSSFDPNWMGKYMNDVIGNISKNINQQVSRNNQGNNFSNYEIFETHDYTIVKLIIPNNIHPKNIRVFLSFNKLKVQGLFDDLAVIQLPVNGQYKGSKAFIKEEVLEIRVPKDTYENYRELNIKHIK